MINTSMAYKRAIDGNREFSTADKITFSDETTMTLTMGDFLAYSINEATSASGKFEIGAAVIKEYNATLKNDDGRFDTYDFEGADLLAQIGLKLEDGTWEILQRGNYRIVSAKATELTIQIKAYDSMLFFDRPYSTSKLTYPATVNQIIQNACTDCQMTYDASTVELGSYVVKTRPKADSITYRDVISYCAQIMGCYARIDHLDKLSFGWYKFGDFEQDYDGGVFDDATPYSSGVDLDGGNFDDYSSGDNADGGDFDSQTKYHHFYNLGSQTINTDDIRITGIQVSVKGESSDDIESVLYGKEGYVLEIADNPLIQTGAIDAVAQHVGAKLVGNTFRPLSITCQSDPSIEAGDIALVTDRRQRTYQTVITNTTFSLGGLQKVECTAETPIEKNYTKYGAVTKLMAQVGDDTQRRLSAYDIAVQNMNQLAANTLGFYATTIKQMDGSVLVYRHDKPKLSESKIVYKSGLDGFFVTQDYTGDDSTTAWKAGFDNNGNAVVNILSAIGINFSWASGGTIRLGGENNSNGVLYVFDANKELIGKINKDGLYLEQGVVENVNKKYGVATRITDGSIKFLLDDAHIGSVSASLIKEPNGTSTSKGVAITVPQKDSNSQISIGYESTDGTYITETYRMLPSGGTNGYVHRFHEGVRTDRLYASDASCNYGVYVKSTVKVDSRRIIKNMYIVPKSDGTGTLYLTAGSASDESISETYYISVKGA